MKTNNFTEHYEKLENYLLGMGQDTLGDHMHIQSIRSRHRACNIFPPLLDELLKNIKRETVASAFVIRTNNMS